MITVDTYLRGLCLVLGALLVLAGIPARSADDVLRDLSGNPELGQALYENHCRGCHESSVHIRARQRASSTADIEAWVLRWVEFRQLDWTGAEIRAVSDYLNREFYHY